MKSRFLDRSDLMAADQLSLEDMPAILPIRHRVEQLLDRNFQRCQHGVECQVVGAHPVGSVVRLGSDRLALVVDQDPSDHRQPRVRTFYSIAMNKMIQPEDIQLAHCFGRDRIVGQADPEAFGIRDFAKLRLRLFTAACKAAG